MLLKEEGEKFFKLKEYQKACDHYKDALTNIFESKFYESELKLKVEAAKISSNISLMYYKLSKEQNDDSFLHESKIYAKKTIRYNPKWVKGYLRLADVCKQCKDVDDILNAITAYLLNNKDDVLNDDFISLLNNVNYYTHKSINELSPSWHLVKYKDNVFVVDCLGAGHFKDFEEFLKYHGTSVQRISVLVRPGVYIGTYELTNAIIDIVGDCNIEINPITKAVDKDPTVIFTNTRKPMTFQTWTHYRNVNDVIQNKPLSRIVNSIIDASDDTFHFIDCKVSLKRISVYEQILHHPINAISCENTVIKLVECSFLSKCSTSLILYKNSELNCQSCRSVGGLSGVMTGKNTYAKLTDCFISETTGTGIEAKVETKMIILKHCTITKCKRQGLVVFNGAKCAKLVDCRFEENCSELSTNVGSMQFKNSRVLVKNTTVENQNCCGIVIEDGSGKFDNVIIKNCDTGIGVQANVEIVNCSIMNCSNSGIILYNFIKGGVVLENNTIKCSVEIGRFDTSVMPIFKGEKKHSIKTISHETFYNSVKTTRSRKAAKGFNIGPVGDVLGINDTADRSIHPASACGYCGYTNFQYKTDEKTLKACGECKMAFYCSPECQQKAWKTHKPFCEMDRKNKFPARLKEIQSNGMSVLKKSDISEIEDKNPCIGKVAGELGSTVKMREGKSYNIETTDTTGRPEWKRKIKKKNKNKTKF